MRPVPEDSSLVERRIAEAAQRGDFDDLPGSGQPIAGLDRPYEPGWWARQLIEREDLTASSDLDEIDRQLSVIWTLRTEPSVRKALDQLNARLATLEVPPFDASEILLMWRRFALFRRNRPR